MTPLYPIEQPLPQTSGIYRITCTITGKLYIGSTVNLHYRRYQHFWYLRCDKHDNTHLQRAWNKHGEDAFIFEVLELVLIPFLIEREQYWLDKLKPFGKKGFNIARVAGSTLGRAVSPETREKLRKAQLGKKQSEETRRKNSESSKGKKHSAETLEKMSRSQIGRTLSDEHRAKISTTRTGTKASDKTRKKVGEASKGRKHSPESIEKVRLVHIGKKRSAETCANISASKMKRPLIVTSPDGTEYIIRIGLNQFCKEHQLSRGNLTSVAKGLWSQHKGWKARFLDESVD